MLESVIGSNSLDNKFLMSSLDHSVSGVGVDEILNVREFVHAFVGTVDHAAGPCDGAGAGAGRAIGYGAATLSEIYFGLRRNRTKRDCSSVAECVSSGCKNPRSPAKAQQVA